MVDYLESAGIPETDATQFAEILASEEPENKQEPFGSKAKQWLVDNLKKATSGLEYRRFGSHQRIKGSSVKVLWLEMTTPNTVAPAAADGR